MRALLAAVALGAFLLPAQAVRAADRLEIGLSLPTQLQERWVRDREAMIADARARAVDLRVQIAEHDAILQIAQCENLIRQGVKVLILAPHDAASAATIVDRAVAAGVKVISYDRLVTRSRRDYVYLSFDNVKVGELQGRWLVEHAPRGNYVVLSGAPTDHNAKLLREGAMRFIQPLVDRRAARVVLDQWVTDWQPEMAERLCDEAIRATGGRIDAVLAPNDGTAGGCLRALAAHGLAGKVPITGQDAEVTAAIRIVQ